MELERIAWSGDGTPDERELRRCLRADGFEVTSWSDGADAYYAPHRHEHDESLWCVRGAITFEIDGRTYPLGPGDRLMLPGGTLHAARAGADGATYLIGER